MQKPQEQQLQLRRQNFDSGRQLLLNKGVPFDPDELLRDEWTPHLKATLDAMPEMHQTRYETAPLNGAYLADTVYLPEKVQISGHTLILANYIVFEGKNPVIKGNFDLHFFPRKPVVVLGTSLAEALHKKAAVLNVKYAGKHALPPFALIRDLGQTGPHTITLDVSGLPPQWALRPAQKAHSNKQNASWNGLQPSLFSFQSTIPCSRSCNNNGTPGATGTSGASPSPAANGANSTETGANGSCASGQSPNGFFGGNGGNGTAGKSAGDGGTGAVGHDAGNINANIIDGDTNQYVFNAIGGNGGKGGPGGVGGTGGNGGTGAAGGNGVSCPVTCTAGIGGTGGTGGAAGENGKGGNGGQGGDGAGGGTLTVSLPFNGSQPITNVSGGDPGPSGDPGAEGVAGNPGTGGPGGEGAKDCHGNQASNGSNGNPGNAAGGPGPGNPGPNGQFFGNNGSVSISFRPDPNGGGGGGGDPCLGSGGGGFQPGSGNTPDPECSPILIDTEGEGFHLTSALTGVTFDISGTGHSVQMAWTDGHYHNAFLALPGADGLVHSGKQLFGNFTPQPQSSHPNGFIALAQYDKPENGGNGDGIIDERDQVYSQLRLWIDENHDGVCQPNELHRLPELGVYSLALKYLESRRKDEWGNQFRYKAQVNPGDRKDARDQTPSGDPGRWTYDVFFVVK
ncbi:MAG TPA: hypothetical protein VI636_24290 [Candidatus Angelobacter sp.]